MKISIEWLKDYVGYEGPIQELVDTLPMLGLEVEETTNEGTSTLDHVVVGEIISKEPHPEADRLSVCKVSVSEKEQNKNIVCGATNFNIGDRVPVALPGATLPAGFKIKKSKLRGVTSEGMMCSAKELELGEDDQGLLIFEKRPKVGTPIHDLFSSEPVLELEITANRGDCLSHIGVAREIAAFYNKKLTLPKLNFHATSVQKVSPQNLIHSITIESESCPYYNIYSIKGVKIGPSPSWLVSRLENVGARSINNIVDITNYVLFETGQPLHAFDAKKIKGNRLIVRQANEDEKIITLDQVERTLKNDDMVIADQEKPLVIAGIMGSKEAEVDSSTTDILIEAAWFKPSSVRGTARKLGLHSDSSQRFSRDVDPEGVQSAAKRAIDLILEIAGGEALPEVISIGEPPRTSRSINISKSFVENHCGFEIESDQLVNSWERLGFSVEGNDPWLVNVPSFRSEVDRPIDLVEEFIRIHGTEELNNSRIYFPANHRENDFTYDFCEKCINNLVGQGFQEVYNYSLRNEEEINSWFSDFDSELIKLKNPLTSDHTHIRPSLLPGLLDCLAANQKNLNSLTQVFETGRVFRPGPRGNTELISVAFSILPKNNLREWKKIEPVNFFDLKRIVNRLFHSTGINLPNQPWTLLENQSSWQYGHATSLGNVHQNKIQISAGIINLELSKGKEIKGPVLAAEILIDPVFLGKRRKPSAFQAFSSFPPAIKDLSLVADSKIPAEDVRAELESIARQVVKNSFLVDSVTIFDLFSGEGLPEDKKSVACSMRFRASDRTLSEKEVNNTFESIVKKIEADTAYTLRT